MGNKTNLGENECMNNAFNGCITDNHCSNKSSMTNSMNENNIVMAHIEFMFGMEGKPQPCVKIPISLEVAIIAAIISTIDNEKNCD